MKLTSLKVGFYLATRQLKRAGKGTTLLIIFIMTLTFLNLVVVNGILVGLLAGSFQQFKNRYSGDVLITPQDRLEYVDRGQQILNYIKGQDGVLAYSARSVTSGTVRAELDKNPTGKESPNENRGSVVGIDPNNEEQVTGISDLMLKGETLNPNDSDYILIGASLIKEYSSFADANFPGFTILRNVKVGDRVRLTLSIRNLDKDILVSKDLTVKGIIKSKVDQVSQRFFILNSELRKMTGNTDLNYQELAIKTKPQNTDAIVAGLKDFADLSKVRVQYSAEAVPSFLRQVEQTFDLLGNIIGGIALVVASITIFIVIFINAITRKKYIGILKGIGIESHAIQIAYVFQALFYGFLGSSIGFFLVFYFLKPFFDQHPLDFAFSDGILAATYQGSLIRAGLLMLITILAGFIPATIIVRKNTLDSILGR